MHSWADTIALPGVGLAGLGLGLRKSAGGTEPRYGVTEIAASQSAILKAEFVSHLEFELRFGFGSGSGGGLCPNHSH